MRLVDQQAFYGGLLVLMEFHLIFSSDCSVEWGELLALLMGLDIR